MQTKPNHRADFQDSLGTRGTCVCWKAGYSSENTDRVWGIYYQRAALCCGFLWAKWLNAKDIQKEIFPVNSVKCLSRKHHWVEKFSQGRLKVADDARQGAEVAETTVKKLSMLRVSKQWQSYGTNISMSMDDMSRNKWFLQVRISHVLHFISICDPFTDSSSYLYWATTASFQIPSNPSVIPSSDAVQSR
jgi:hypothetical protein